MNLVSGIIIKVCQQNTIYCFLLTIVIWNTSWMKMDVGERSYSTDTEQIDKQKLVFTFSYI